MKKSKRLRLSHKIMLGFALLGILICACTGVTGYFQYRNNLQQIYNATAYDIAETAVSCFGEEELTDYAALALGYDGGTVSEEEIAAAVAFIVLTTVITSLIGIISPAFSRIFLDRLLTGQNPDWLGPFIMALAALSAVQLLVAWINAVWSLRINGKLAVTGSASFLWKVLRMPMEFFSQRMAGDIQMRQGSNASIAGTLVNTFAPLALNTAMMVFYLVVMLRYSWLLTLIGISSVFINLLVGRIISAKRVNITRVQMRDAGKLAGATVAGIEMIETIKASGGENG